LLKIHLIAMKVAFILSTLASAPPSVPAAPVQSAHAFVESIGVNTHLGYTGTPYYRFRKVEAALERLGVHHIRDAILLRRPDVDRRYRALAKRGIKLDALVGQPKGGEGTGTVEQQLSVIEGQIGRGAIASLEGPNEFDDAGIANWPRLLRAWVKHLWHGAKARPALRSLPILGPSLVDPESRAELGDISPWTTFGNMHPYPGGDPPDETAHFESEFELAAINTPGEPVQATETGYTTAVDSTDNQPPVSERVAGIYMPRLLLENFRRGIVRTYLYELVDVAEDRDLDEGFAGFGLLRSDFHPKPAFSAIRNLIEILSEPDRHLDPRALEYELEGVPAETRQVLLEKSDGDYFLALWNPVGAWDVETGREWVPPPVTGTLRLAKPAREVALFQPNRSPRPIATAGRSAEVSFPLAPRVTIIEVRQ
jgi:hypothetical protein